MFRSISTIAVVIAMVVSVTGSALAQSEYPENRGYLFTMTEVKSIQLTDNWLTIEPGMMLVVHQETGDDIHVGTGRLRAKLVDGVIANDGISPPPSGVEIGQPAEGLALVVEYSNGAGATYFGYQDAFHYTLVVLSENVLHIS